MRSRYYLFYLASVVAATQSVAQSPSDVSPESAYQRGAGAYFAGRADEAIKRLTAAIQYAPDDPRGYYMRGLTHLAIGEIQKAQADLTQGARIEARMGSSSPLVDQSLASVQGAPRMMLERIRRAARESAQIQERRTMALARKQAREERERRVLRTDYQLPIEALASRLTVDQARGVAIKDRTATANLLAVAQPSTGAPAPANPPAADNPFADDPPAQAETFATSTESSSNTAGDVPAAARGSIKASKLFGIFSRHASDAVDGVGRSISGVAGQAMGGGGPAPFAGASGPNEANPFADGAFEQNGFNEGNFEPTDVQGDAFMDDGQNPFDFAE